ncbi:MAG: type II toxin-antitoxin system RelE/ParE family toxin [Desulfofustis sp. PB-SRB1]|jgi:toxin ParE1/3/4|nr:type II toxin-antitoxin system RelE/ParE family toxin [Desulfofustis sp. PB-SRB1]MBM1001484.1 type II toxin-antitoxin system RelE/ParE family toxin [Desulfofustis sp. PB-SRB1]HBH28172.1 type II toxin-antitoxin system RelE/ParE family toxin [Desulfofustis sp.]HBH31363.1 type II toxin-antitoxin system RelE/ParE family toxin [Desulfofustis sp.]
MRKTLFSREAIEDLEEIWFYIAQDSPDRADDFLDQLYSLCTEKLAPFPEAGSGRDYLAKEVFAFSYKRYMIYYRFDANRIEIIRVLHGSRDLPALFQ